MNVDYNEIIELLRGNKLPYKDIISSKVEFITHRLNGSLVGCIGIENYGKDRLLRSFAVNDAYKSKGVGKKLLKELIVSSKEKGVKKLHLLTTTADLYFAKNGFFSVSRNNAPEKILESKEFSEICPSSSIYMVLEIK